MIVFLEIIMMTIIIEKDDNWGYTQPGTKRKQKRDKLQSENSVSYASLKLST